MQIRALYAIHNPAKLDEPGWTALMAKYNGQEQEQALLNAILSKYKVPLGWEQMAHYRAHMV